jgi:chromosome segregation ATPase
MQLELNASDEHVSASTGLTPHICRTTLEPGSGTKRRHHSARALKGPQDRPDTFDSTIDTRHSGEVTFLPLRQVLDGRVKRRIRRNGLSEEINVITAEKRRKAQQTNDEIAALRSEVAAKDAEIRRLSGATVVGQEDDDDEAQGSIDELKKQVAQLRRVLKSPDSSNETEDTVDYSTTSGRVDWAVQVRDPFPADYSDMELDVDDEFGDETIADLVCSTPSRRKRADVRNSFPTPPSTSPHLEPLATPSRRPRPVTPTSQAAAVQTSFTAAEREQLEDELASLQLEMAKLTGTLETYESMASRLADRLSPFSPKHGSAAALIMDSRSPAVRVEAQLNNLLQVLSDRTAALEGLDASLAGLGFPGTDASEVVVSLSSAFRTARLELEYLTPGEIALPLTAAGASVLDLLLTRLRELARRTIECEDAIDEYHVLEQSLRKQLGAGAEAVGAAEAERDAAVARAASKDARIRELEVGVQRLKGAVKSYTRDVSELEGLVQRLEGDLDTAGRDLRAAREHNEEKDLDMAMLEEKLGLALEQTSELKDQLEGLRARHKEEVFSLSQRHGVDLVMRDARVSELKLEVDRVNEALREANETVQNLRVENGALCDRLDSEKAKAKAAIETMRDELERVVRMGQDLMATPRKNPGRGSRPS